MKKKEMHDSIIDMFEQMRHIMDLCNINVFVLKGSENVKYEDIKEAYDWVKNIYNGSYTVAKNLRKQIPEQQWLAYLKFGITDLPEVEKWKKVSKEFKASFKNRPKYFRRNYVSKFNKKRKNIKGNTKESETNKQSISTSSTTNTDTE